MAVTLTSRLGLNKWSVGTDPFTRAQTNADHDALELLSAIDQQGLLASRPAAATRGKYYWSTDVAAAGAAGGKRLYRDDGAAWYEIVTTGSTPAFTQGIDVLGKINGSLAAPAVALRLALTSAGGENALNITPYGAAAVIYASGAESTGSVHTARAASATQFEQLNAGFNWYANAGLTAGAAYTRTLRMNLSTTGLLSVTGGLDVSGSPSDYGGGEIRFPSGAAALATLATGSPLMLFDHRAVSNTGTWTWRNGSDAASTQMSLSAVGVLTAGPMVANGDFRGTATSHKFGAGALGATGAYADIGDQGDPRNVYLVAAGSGADIALVLRAKGPGQVVLQTANGGSTGLAVRADSSVPANESVVYTRCNLAGTFADRAFLIGALDSAGAGFRAIKISN